MEIFKNLANELNSLNEPIDFVGCIEIYEPSGKSEEFIKKVRESNNLTIQRTTVHNEYLVSTARGFGRVLRVEKKWQYDPEKRAVFAYLEDGRYVLIR